MKLVDDFFDFFGDEFSRRIAGFGYAPRIIAVKAVVVAALCEFDYESSKTHIILFPDEPFVDILIYDFFV